MTLSHDEIMRVLFAARPRLGAAAYVIARDAQAAEDIFQNVALKALTQDVTFAHEGALLSWATVSARREALDWLRKESDLHAVLGKEFITVYAEIKELEFDEFMKVISPWEREHLLLHV